jgi:hypothetical protein
MQASSNTNNTVMNKNTTYVKVTAGEENRMVAIAANATFAELEEQVRRSFRAGEQAQLDMRYVDEEKDKVCVSSDEELRYALDYFAGRTMRLYLTFKAAAEECTRRTTDQTWANDACDEEKKLKEKLDEAGFDVPQWRCRKLIAKWNGNVDLAFETVRTRRERNAQRMAACEGQQMLPPPPGFPPMPIGHHHGLGAHHFGGHHHHHHGPHQFKAHHHHHKHHHHHEGEEAFEHPKWRKFAHHQHHHHGPEHAFPARGCFRGPHPHPHGGPRPHRGCHPMPECGMPPMMMPHNVGFPPHAHPHCHRRFNHCGGGGRRGPMFA